MRLDELARQIEAEVEGDGSIEITSVAPLDRASAGQISFLTNPKYASNLESTAASAGIVGLHARKNHVTLLRAKDPVYSYSRAMTILHGNRSHPHKGVHPRAYVEAGPTIGPRTIVYPGAYIGADVRVGEDCVVY